ITAITAQNTQDVTAVYPIPDDIVAAQIQAVFDDIDIHAVKIGMLGTPRLIETVARALEGYTGPIVLDPVMVSKSGVALLEDSAISALKTHLLPRAMVLTPNLPEAAKLLDQIEGQGDVHTQAQALRALGPQAVLMKGGHAAGDLCTDILLTDGGPQAFSAPRIATRNTHGTGCSYSAAIAAGLAKGHDFPQAVKQAHDWLHQAIMRADELGVGHGHGPVHHFHRMWG
ncbi:MAG: bifunctional hydroxymethylpyrimidine kinase/phosphomethylpyrimidine kinase, partial [Pseudomonadota bacterium]